jgi:hypothetical protein
VFTLGFGIAASVLTNNVAALGALINGVRPMRKVAAYEAERRHLLELQLHQSGFLDAAQVPAEEPEGMRNLADPGRRRSRTVRRAGERW